MITRRSRFVFLILSIVIPLLYLSMYLPIWGGKELLLENSGALGIVLFAFQCLCIVFATVRLRFDKMRNNDRCLVTLASTFFFIASLVMTVLVGYFFVLELLNIPWFPAQR